MNYFVPPLGFLDAFRDKWVPYDLKPYFCGSLNVSDCVTASFPDMASDYFEDHEYRGEVFSPETFPQGDYDQCVFEGCDFSNARLGGRVFTGCRFVECNLGNAQLANTSFNEVIFTGCKMIGIRFEACNAMLLRFAFVRCQLDYSSFYGMSLKKQVFDKCSMVRVDFTGTKLPGATFGECNLKDAVFEDTVLEKADFRTAWNVILDPARNRVKGARFQIAALPGLLGHFGLDIQ